MIIMPLLYWAAAILARGQSTVQLCHAVAEAKKALGVSSCRIQK